MNYKKLYDLITERATLRDWIPTTKHYRLGKVLPPQNSYTEVHHIVPRVLGGTNKKDNLAVLSVKEHYICHLLLTKIYPNERKLAQAFYAMKRHVKDELFTVRLREFQKEYSSTLWMDKNYAKKVSTGVAKYWENPKNRKDASERLKEQYKDVELAARRTKHFKDPKTAAHKAAIGKKSKSHMNKPEIKAKYSSHYKESNFNNSRKVINLETFEVYDYAQKAAFAIGKNYQTVKKWLYLNIPKHNLKWLDNYHKENSSGINVK